MAFSGATIRLAARSADAFFARALPVIEKLSTLTWHQRPRKGPQGHQLSALFEGLSEDLKDSIETQYSKAPNRPSGMGSTCRVTATETVLRIEVRDTPSNRKTDSRSLRGVLRRSEDVFVSWRYFHEIPKPASDIINFEFFDLNAIAEILKSATERDTLTLAGRGLWVLHKGE